MPRIIRPLVPAVAALATAGTLTLGLAAQAGAAPAAQPATTASTAAAATASTTLVAPTYINAANATKVTLTGVAQAGDTIALKGTDSGLIAPKTVTGTVTVPAGGSWSQTIDTSTLADGKVTFTATPSDSTGTAGTAVTATSTKDTSAPGAPATVTPSPAPYTATTTPLTVSGTTSLADASSTLTVDVTVTDAAKHTVSVLDQPVTAGATPLNASTFSVTVPAASMATLDDGSLTVSALFHDAAGNAGPATTASDEKGKLALVSSSPAQGVTVSSPSAVSTTYNQTLSGSGTGTTSAITVKNAAGTAVTGTSAVAGRTISFTPAATLPDGTYTATSTAYDAAYTTESSTDTVTFTVSSTAAPAAPVISSVTDPINAGNVTAVVVKGTADLTTTPVAVRLGALTMSVTPASDHSWTATFDASSVPDGSVAVSATQTGANGKVSTAGTATTTKDTVAPRETAAAPKDGSTVQSASAVGFAFDEDLATGTITIPGVTGTTKVDGKTVILTASSPLADGTYTATGTVTDAAGNMSTATTTFTVSSTAVTSTTSLNPTPATVRYGDRLTLAGAVTLSSGTATGSVSLTATTARGTVVKLGSVPLSSTGSFSTSLAPGVDATYQATYNANGDAQSSVSRTRHTDVAQRVTASSATGKHTAKAVVKGTASPAAAGTKVTLYRVKGNHPVKIATGKVGSSHRFTLRVSLPKGRSVLIAAVAATKDNSAGSARFTARRT